MMGLGENLPESVPRVPYRNMIGHSATLNAIRQTFLGALLLRKPLFLLPFHLGLGLLQVMLSGVSLLFDLVQLMLKIVRSLLG